MALLLALVVFLLGAAAVVCAYAGLARLPETWLRRRIEGRMTDGSAPLSASSRSGTVVKRQIAGLFPAVDRLAVRTGPGANLADLIEQSGVRISVGTVLMAALGCAALTGVIAAVAIHLWWAWIPAALVGLAAPFLLLRNRRTRRLRKFEEQFPEALDLLSRAIRAGHAFTTAMGMVADEGLDPVSPEFRKTFDEQNFGLPLKDALNTMSERVPLLDVRFFVTAVLIQRETGGNLSEILDNLAHVVRERFKILRQVRVYTAHGRFTGWVLMALPAALAVALMFINPDHMNLLFHERMGQQMLVGAVVMQIIGYFWIRHVIKIEV